jgi:ribokinase
VKSEFFDLVFVGRANIDLTVEVPQRPVPGTTVFASTLTTAPGGKSLNQAVAVARLGGTAALVAHAGKDQWGLHLDAALTDAGVDTTFFRLVQGVSTGVAIIEVTPDGENSLVLAVSPGAELAVTDVEAALEATSAAVVIQLDIAADSVGVALNLPRPRLVIGNLVPDAALDLRLLQRLDLLVVNEHEAQLILDTPDIAPIRAAGLLRDHGPRAVVVTVGAGGAAYSEANGGGVISAPDVTVVDTTGAGDAFLGSLALDLSRGASVKAAVKRAVRVGAEAVQHHGALLPVGLRVDD